MTQIGLIFCAIALLHNGVLALDCFERDIDYDGTNINNGLEQKTDNEVNCQQLCKHIIGCEGFTWASSNFADVDYRNACWLKKDIIGKYAKNEALSGPKECGSDGNCCDLVYFGSTGSMDGSVQNHVIGNYEKTSEGPEGHWNYKQQGGKLVMYYVPWLEVWYIGDTLGANLGYVLGRGTATCPEGMDGAWNYNDGGWVSDPEARAQCI